MLSEYLLEINRNNKIELFNMLNGKFIEISVKAYEDLKNENYYNIDNNTIEFLRETQFIDVDIRDCIENFFNNTIGSLVLNLTNMCNFECDYCYYKASNKDKHKQVLDKNLFIYWFSEIYLKKFNNITDLHITYIGGEPTLEKQLLLDITTYINNICLKNNINVIYSLITNGYHLSSKFASHMVNLGINHVQITLDGYKDEHEKYRKDKLSGHSYDRIINNLKNCINYLNICIRINFDEKTKEDNIYSLLCDLKRIGIKDIYFAALEETVDTVQSCNLNIIKNEHIIEKYDKLWNIKNNLGFKFNQPLPPLTGSCMSKNLLAFNIDSDGYVYSCPSTAGIKNKRLFHISNENFTNKNIDKKNNCIHCKYYPICMGGCEYQESLGTITCNRYIYDKLIPKYLNYKY